MSCGSSSSSTNGYSNLEQFLFSVTPIVPSRTLSQSCVGDINNICQPFSKDKIQYFTLGDLWECYSEWSAYGVRTPVQSKSGDTISQFFVPYLSALQIYSNKSMVDPRNDSVEFESDSSWSDDSGSDKLSRSLSNNSSRGWDGVSEDSSVDLETLSPMNHSNNNNNNKLGSLYFQYIETSHPYVRPPLMEKVTELAKHYPGLMTLKSVELCPASWMAVAWYPIYSIPCQKNEKDLSTSFLTYHTLSSSFEDCELENSIIGSSGSKSCHNIGSLCPFGLASYKMEGDLWFKKGKSDYVRKVNLYSAADSWLKQLNVHHHDFYFFTHHYSPK